MELLSFSTLFVAFVGLVLIFVYQLRLTQAKAKITLLETQLKEVEEDLSQAEKRLSQYQQEQQAQQGLSAILQPFKEQLQGFERRVQEVHTHSVAGQAALKEQLQQMKQMGERMGDEAQSLALALKGNKKVLGNWGELQLEMALERAGLEKNIHYVTQKTIVNHEGDRLIPDVMIFLPENKHIVVDSKVSLSAYQKAVASEDEGVIQTQLTQLVKDIRHHVDDLAKKGYASLSSGESLGFVFMFMPIEAAYIEACKHDDTLFQYAYAKGVVIVSQTTLMPTLRTVANLWVLATSNRQAMEIGNKALDVYNQLMVLSEHLLKLGNTISSLNKQYNQVVTSFVGNQGLVNKTEKFKRFSTKIAKESVELSAVELEPQYERLEKIGK